MSATASRGAPAVVAALYAEMNGIMDRLSQQPGAKELASAF